MYLYFLNIFNLIFFFTYAPPLPPSFPLVQAARRTRKKRAQRATSNVFAMFNQEQIQEFKEAFSVIDQNHDGVIDESDLKEMLGSLGQQSDDA